MVRKMMLRHHPDNLAALADHDLGIKGEPAGQFGAELRAVQAEKSDLEDRWLAVAADLEA